MDALVRRLRKKRERFHDLSGVYWSEDMLCQEAADRIEADAKRIAEAVKMLDEKDREYNRLTNDMIERHAAQIADLKGRLFTCSTDLDIYLKAHASAEARVKVLEEALRERDGGRHDQDCRFLLNTGRPCNCGHVEARAALEGEK